MMKKAKPTMNAQQAMESIYKTLLQRGLCQHRVDFSLNWLNASRAYMSTMRSVDFQPSTTVMFALYSNLRDVAPDLANLLHAFMLDTVT